jgi:hypothetical protein
MLLVADVIEARRVKPLIEMLAKCSGSERRNHSRNHWAK